GHGTQHLTGRCLYGGNWMGQFGHFITETLTTLWPDPARFDGVVFHPFIFGAARHAWQEDAVSLAGWGDLPLQVITEATSVEHLTVASRPYLPNRRAGRRALEVWRRVTETAGADTGPPRVF